MNKELVEMTVSGSLCYSDQEMVKFKIQREVM